MNGHSLPCSGSTGGFGEIYSPPRMVEAARRRGMPGCFSLDLTTCDDDGSKWDFTRPEMQERAINKIDKEQPHMLIVCPPCTLFSILQALNFYKQDSKVVEARLRAAMVHLSFAIFLCLKQSRAGRYYMFEHPARATSLNTNVVKQLYIQGGGVPVMIVMCIRPHRQ